MIITLLIVVMIVMGMGGAFLVVRERDRREVAAKVKDTLSVYGVEPAALTGLSKASKALLKERMALPASSRPDGDLAGMLAALDLKHGGAGKVDAHFTWVEYSYTRNGFSWNNCSCNAYMSSRRYMKKCSFAEFVEIHKGFEAIAKALADQKYQLEMAGISGQLESVNAMVESLRNEAKMIQTVTKEIVA